jgi:hypothetical protein
MPETETAKPATTRRTGKTAAQEKAAEAEAQKAAEKDTEAPRSVWERLAAPFPQEDLERLPKPLQRDDRNKGRCAELPDGRPNPYSADGYYCGGWHSRSVHLTYVGHAGITTRLNQVLTPAGWEFGPVAVDPAGLPLIQRGEFWAELKIIDPDSGLVATKTDVAANFNSTQEAWGDALRRCAMRFGVGTYLWSKSEAAHAQAQYAEPLPEPEPQAAPPVQENQAPPTPPPHVEAVKARLRPLGPEDTAEVKEWWVQQGLPHLDHLDEWQAAAVQSYLNEREGNAADPSEAR